MNREKSRTLAIDSLLCTLTIIFCAIPISIGPVRLAVLMLVPTMIAAQTLKFASALFTGTFLGITSMITAYIAPVSPVSIALQNPIISVLPRMLVGIVVYYVYHGLRHLISNERFSESVARSVSTIMGVLTNTGFVSLFIWLFYMNTGLPNDMPMGVFMETVILANFAVEIVVCTIITPPISLAVSAVMRRAGGQ